MNGGLPLVNCRLQTMPRIRIMISYRLVGIPPCRIADRNAQDAGNCTVERSLYVGSLNMSRFGGFGNLAGLGDIQKIAKQAQKMQEDAARLQEDLGNLRVTGQAGGGMVTATVDGHGRLVELKINPVVADPQDIEMLE